MKGKYVKKVPQYTQYTITSFELSDLRPANIQISLAVHLRIKKLWIIGYSKYVQWRFWSNSRMRRLIWIFAGRTSEGMFSDVEE